MSKYGKYGSEADFVKALCRDDKGAWEVFHEVLGPKLRYTFWRSGWFQQSEVEEMVHDLYVKLPRALKKFRGSCTLRSYVTRIAVHLAIERVRYQSKWRGLILPFTRQKTDGDEYDDEPPDPDGSNPYHEAVKNEQLRALREAMSNISEMCQRIIQLRYVDDLDYRTTARELGLSINTIGSRLHKCMMKLREYLEEHAHLEDLND